MSAKVLIVDDEEDVLRSTEMLVEALGYEAVALKDPAQVLEVAERERPGLILQDLKMEGLNLAGYVASLRSNPLTADIPLVFFSASLDLPQTAAKYDAWGYLAKPFSEEELSRVLERTMGPARRERKPHQNLERDVRSVFHDYWNLLSALSSYTQVLSRSPHLDPQEKELVESLDEVVLKLESKTDRLRAFLQTVLAEAPA